MGKRKAEDEEWELFKDEILDLYASNTLYEVMDIMNGKGFRRTKSQYEGRLKKWRDTSGQRTQNNIRTNITTQEWKYIVERIDERQEAGKSSLVTVRGFEVPQSRIKKQGKVHAYKTALEKLAPKVCLTEAPDVVVSTPPERSLTPVLMHRYPDFSLCLERLPWRTFADQLNTIIRLTDGTSSQSNASSGSLHPTTQLTMNLGADWTGSHIAKTISAEIYLPIQCALIPATGIEPCLSLSVTNRQLELLKYFLGMVSNCHFNNDIFMKIGELANDKTNLKFFSCLFSIKGETIRAFTEKIMLFSLEFPAFESDIALVEIALDAGADLNCEDSEGLSLLDLAFRRLACLEDPSDPDYNITLRSRYEGIILELLARGVKFHGQAADLGLDYDVPPSPLDLLINYASQNTVNSFLEFGSLSRENHKYITSGTFIITAFNGNVGLFQRLSILRPKMLAELKQSPWLLFEAAAFGLSTPMIKHLQAVGFDINSTDSRGNGSPLVFACIPSTSGNETFQYLLGAGASINRYANGDILGFLGRESYGDDLKDEYLKDGYLEDGYLYMPYRKIAPIHAAVRNGSKAHVECLLEHNARPNQRGYALPIQFAILGGKKCLEITKLLLDADANPNLTARVVPKFGSEEAWYERLPYEAAIIQAVRQGNLELFQMLFKAGAELPIPPRCTCVQHNVRSGGDDWMRQPFGLWLEHHDTENMMCAHNHEHRWNILLLAKNEKIFCYLLNIAPEWLKFHWVSRRCFSRAVDDLEWKFVSQLIGTGIFPTHAVDHEALFINSICNDDEMWKDYWNDISSHSMFYGFIIAVSHSQTKIVQGILDKGIWPDDEVPLNFANPNLERPYIALSWALDLRNKEMRSVFLKHYNQIIHSSDSNDLRHLKNAYAIAIRHGDIEFAKFVLAGKNVNEAKFIDCPNSWSSSPKLEFHSAVHIASAFRHHGTVQWLLAQGADPNISHDALTGPSSYHSPLQCAAKEGDTALVITLLEEGARVNDVPINAKGATALQFAAILGDFKMLKVLLDAGADINAPPSKWEGRTAIEGAAEWGRLDMVSFLMEAGADIQGRYNANYRRTVYRAWVHGHHVLAEMVQQWKSERYGEDDCEPIESMIQSMDRETLGCAEQDRLQLPGPENCYYDPCRACKRGCNWDE